MKPLNQIKANLTGMVLGWSPFNIVSDSPTLHSKWLLLLKIEISSIVHARFGVIWFSGFRGEDLNVIFYQNMPNLHNRYKSAERKISQKNPEYMFQRRRFKCENLRRTTDGRQVMAKAHMAK
jgi:hypothetical protein